MKKIIFSTLCIGMLATSGCATIKQELNLKTNRFYVAQLPEYSTTRLQIITDSAGWVNITPNSTKYIASTKENSSGLIARNAYARDSKSLFDPFTDAEKTLIYDNDLGMIKPSEDELEIYTSLGQAKLSAFTITERYITPNEPAAFLFDAAGVQKYCKVSGSFTPKPDTDYRLIGIFGHKCVLSLHQLITNANKESMWVPIKLN